jgi:class 3 adenylate cyclase/tetratricopeptide (TPR) repeat protein
MAICAECGAENPDRARFCNECAAPLTASAPRQEQRKVVTVLFCDVAGSTELGERLDPETLRNVMGAYFDVARVAIERHGGTVEKFIGDAVMAVFGVPRVHEDDALRAVRAAQELRDAVEIDVRIGVNTGEVVTGGGDEKLVTGDAVNIAARLEQAADTGEVLLGDETYRLVRDAVTVETLEPITVKGKAEPLTVHRLVAVDAAASGVARHLDAPMVGRSREHRLLEDSFDNAVSRRACALFTLLGTAGVGKSRLTREFLAGVDARVVQGRCLSYGDGITYWPVVEVVKALGGADAAPPEAADTIASLLGESDTSATAEGIAWAVRKLLERAAEEQPLVVLLDDIHWGEPTFFDLVEHVADLSRDAPILLLCLARPELLERRPGWGGGKLNATTTLLEPLDAAETDQLIERLLGDEELDRELEQRIRTASEGNPLFVEEMVAMVRESGERDVVVPPSIKALLAARLDQLDPAERVVLERGSVEGQLFHSAAVQALSTPPAPVDRQLVGLVRKELVRPERPQLPVGDAYRFRHLLIRDAAYDALPKSTRAELHERFAAWLEERGPELVEHDEILGYHYEQAYRYRTELGPPDEAADALAARAGVLLVSAGGGARNRGDFPAALRLMERAADIERTRRLALLPELAELMFEVGDLPGAAALLDEALESAQATGSEAVRAVASVLRALYGDHMGEDGATMEDVLARGEEAVPVLERLGDDLGLATVLDVVGRCEFYAGNARRSVEVHEHARQIALLAGDYHRRREAIHWTLGAMAFGPTPISEIYAYFETVAEAELSGLEREMDYHHFDAGMKGLLGRFDEARESFWIAQGATRQLGRSLQLTGALMALGMIELIAGRFEAAEHVLREGWDGLAELGETGFRSTTGTLLAFALVRLGRFDEAGEILDETERLAAADDADPQVRLRWVRALILVERGEWTEAERLARDAVARASKTDFIVLHADALVVLAEVLTAAVKNDQAGVALREALELYDRKEAAAPAAETRARLEELAVS